MFYKDTSYVAMENGLTGEKRKQRDELEKAGKEVIKI